MTERLEHDAPLFGVAVDLTPFAVIGAAALSPGSPIGGAQATASTPLHRAPTATDPVMAAASNRRSNDGARVLVVGQMHEHVALKIAAIVAAAGALAVFAAKHPDTYQQAPAAVLQKPPAMAESVALSASARPPKPAPVVTGRTEGAHSTNPKPSSEPLAATLERLGGGIR